MKTILTALLSVSSFGTAWAWQAWSPAELFSTPDGVVQFIELSSATNGQGLLGGEALRAVSADGWITNTFTFNHDVSTNSANKTLLIATAGFQNLPGGVLPDYTNLPAGFLFAGGGTLSLVGGSVTQSFGPLPTDGSSSLATPGLTTNRATPKNFTGTSGAVLVAVPGGGHVFYEGLYHNRSGLPPEMETIPHAGYTTNAFLEVQYAATNVQFHFLTAVPAGDGEVSARVRVFPAGPGGNVEAFANAVWLTNILLTATNAFHGVPASESLSTSNQLKNPGFETNGVWWVPFGQAEFTTNAVRSGGFAVRLGDSNNFHGLYQDLRALSNRVYRWGAWARRDAAYTASNTWLKLEWKNAQTQDLAFVDLDVQPLLTTNWQSFSMVATSPAAAAFVRPLLLNRGADAGTNFVYWDDATFTNVPPATDSRTVALWRATWIPPRTFTGTVYYAPQVLVSQGGQVKDFQYLLKTIGPNVGSTNFGINEFFWKNDAQVFGKDYFNLDYSTAWTNPTPFSFDGIYFNSTNSGAPQNESVPGLPGRTFFDWNVTNGLSYVHVLAPPGAVLTVTTRFDFVTGGGEVYLPGRVVTTVVIDAGAPFHGLPSSGAITLDVWRTDFYPPPGWIGQPVYYSMSIRTPNDGATWLVANLANANSGVAVTNHFLPPQRFYTGGPVDRDWSYTPTAAVARAGVQRDYLYHNNTNANPRLESIPAHAPYQFLEVNYATTTTTFYVMTDHPVNVAPGESVTMQVRIDYNHPQTGFNPQYYNLSLDTNLVIGSFHGRPATGTHTVDLWRLDWTQPRYLDGTAVTNALTIYYAPFIKTTLGAQQFQTDYAYLLGVPAGGTPNSFPVQPQFTGPDFSNFDYAYLNKVSVDGDADGLLDEWEMQHFGTLTNGAAGDVDGDGWNNLDEYLADTAPTNAASFFPFITSVGMTGSAPRVVLAPTSPNRVYQLYAKTNLLDASGWAPDGVSLPGTGGDVSLPVLNAAPAADFRAAVSLP